MLTIKKDGGGESSPTSNKVLTTDDAKLLIKQILGETFQFEIEPVEVKSFNPDGSIEGRYCVSEHDRKIQTFKPLNQNVIQYPVADEIVLGIEVFATIGPDNTPVGTRYYFSDLNPLPRRINSQQSNLSNTSSPDNLTNSIFIDEENIRTDVVEGDTIIQGRFDNSITLSSNQPTLNSPNTIIQNGEGQVLMTQNQKVDYSEPSNTLATKMGFDIDYDRPQIIFDSDRILLNAKTNDIGIFAEGDIFIKGNSVNIENANGGVNIKANKIVNDVSEENAKILNLTKDGVPFPDLNIVGFLKQTFGIKEFLLAMSIGVPKLSNPATLPSGVRDIVKGLEGAKDFLEATANLEFLEDSILTTKTPKEIAQALKMPASLVNIVGDIETFSQDIGGGLKKAQQFAEDNEVIVKQANQISGALDTDSRKALLNTLESISEEERNQIPGANDALAIAQDKSVGGGDIPRARENGVFRLLEEYITEQGSVEGDIETLKAYGKILNLTKQE